MAKKKKAKRTSALYDLALTWMWDAGTGEELKWDTFELAPPPRALTKKLLALRPTLDKILDRSLVKFDKILTAELDKLGI